MIKILNKPYPKIRISFSNPKIFALEILALKNLAIENFVFNTCSFFTSCKYNRLIL